MRLLWGSRVAPPQRPPRNDCGPSTAGPGASRAGITSLTGTMTRIAVVSAPAAARRTCSQTRGAWQAARSWPRGMRAARGRDRSQNAGAPQGAAPAQIPGRAHLKAQGRHRKCLATRRLFAFSWRSRYGPAVTDPRLWYDAPARLPSAHSPASRASTWCAGRARGTSMRSALW